MLKYFKCFVVAVLCLIPFCLNASQEEKPTLAVFSAPAGPEVAKYHRSFLQELALAEILKAALISTGAFVGLERDAEILSVGHRTEQLLARAESGDESSFKLIPADYIASVRVLSFSSYQHFRAEPDLPGVYLGKERVSATVDVRVNKPDGSTVFQQSLEKSTTRDLGSIERDSPPKDKSARKSTVKKLFRALLDSATADVAYRISPLSVIDVQGKSAVINRGRNAGLKVGQILIVYSPSISRIDPSTGDPREIPGRRVGEVKVTRVDGDLAWADIAEGVDVGYGYMLRFPQ